MNKKKKIVLGCGIAAALLLCVLLVLKLTGFFDPKPGVGFIRPAEGSGYVDDNALIAAAQEHDVPFLERDLENGLSESAVQLAEEGARVLIISLEDPILQPDREPLRELTRQGVTLLFVGRDPGETFLESCEDLAWYVGSDAALAGELLGEQAAMLRRENSAPDLNEDHLLQYVWLSASDSANESELLQFTLEGCEHYGVYTAESSSLRDLEGDLAEKAVEAWKALDPRPEILLTGSVTAARAALEARRTLGWENIPVAALAFTKEEAHALADEGVSALCYYDLDSVTRAVRLLAANALEQQAITEGTDLVPGGHVFLLPYLPYEF